MLQTSIDKANKIKRQKNMRRVVNIVTGCLNMFLVAAVVVITIAHVDILAAQEKLATISDEDQMCLAQNIYFEANNQSVEGQVAVAWVTLNRMEDPNFPDTICDVVKQARRDENGNIIRNKCQFSWYCDGKSDKIPSDEVSQRAWEKAQLISHVVLLDWARAKASPVENATFYHAHYVNPKWASAFDRVAVVGDHIFYANN